MSTKELKRAAGEALAAGSDNAEGLLAKWALARLEDEARVLDARIKDAQARMPSLESALARAEGESRDAEVGLAQALSAQASETAEARVAEAAFASARGRVERAERDVARVAAEIHALGDPAPLKEARTKAADDKAKAERQAETARTGLARADATERGAIDAGLLHEVGLTQTFVDRHGMEDGVLTRREVGFADLG